MKERSGVNRRGAISRFGALVGSVSLAACERLPSQDEVSTEESIEQKFGIELSTDIPNNRLSQWDPERLSMLSKFLSVFPPHLLAPDIQGRRPKLTLGTLMYFNFPQAGTHEAQMDTSHFSPEHRMQSLFFLTRQLTYLTLVQVHKPENSDRHPWFNQIEDIFGEASSDLKKRLRGEAMKVLEPLHEWIYNNDLPAGSKLHPRVIEEYEFYDSILRGVERNSTGGSYGNKEPDKLIATLAGHYVRGQDYFTNMWKNFLSKRQVDRLYQFVRDEIFRGREYSQRVPFLQKWLYLFAAD